MALRVFSSLWSFRAQRTLVSANRRFHKRQQHQQQQKQKQLLQQQLQQREFSSLRAAPVSAPEEKCSIAGITVAMERALREQRTEEALRVYQFLWNKGWLPSRDCISTLISQLAYKQSPASLTQADKLVQELTAKHRTDLLDHSSLSLLALSYAGVGMPTYARATLKFMFQTGHYPSVKVWVAVVSKIAENREEAPAALELFKEICELTSGLTIPASSNSGPGSAAAVISIREDTSDPVSRIMKLMDHALSLKDDKTLLVQMKPDLSAFNTALTICTKLGLVKVAEEIFHSMSKYGIVPDHSAYNLLIKVYGKAGQFHMFGKISQMMEAAYVKPTGATLKALLDSYVEAGHIQEAEQLLERCIGSESNSMWHLLKLDSDIYNSLLKTYATAPDLAAGAKLLSALPEDDASDVSQGKVVWSMVASGLMTEIYSIIQHMTFHKMPLHYPVYRSLIRGFASNNQVDKAAGVFMLMKRAGIKPDITCYGPLIQGLIRCGDTVLACHTFQEMVDARIQADEGVYVPLLKCLSLDTQASRMLKVMYGLLDLRIKPTAYAWNLVVEALSKRGMIGDAKRLLLRMETTGVAPDSFTFWYVVKGLITATRLMEVAELWPFIVKAITRDRMVLQKEMVDSVLYAFVKGAYFAQASEMIQYAEEQSIPLDKEAFRDLFLRYHSSRFTSKHKSARRVYMRQQQLEDMEQFKKWLQLNPVKIPARYSTQI